MKKLLCLLLAGLMLIGTVGCANEGDETGDTGAVGTSAVSEAETEDPNFACDLPENLDFGGQEVMIIFKDATGRQDELVSDGSGSLVSEAVHTRNVTVEEMLKIKLVTTPSDDVVNAQKLDIEGGVGAFPIVTNGIYMAITPVMEGRYINLTPLNNIDVTKHYWAQGFNDIVTFTDEQMQFLASGPLAISMTRYMYLTIYNKELFEDHKEKDLYEVVKTGDWTLDYQYSVLTGKYIEKDGNNKPSEGDFYGFVTGDTISVDPYMVASDTHMITKDPETYTLSWNNSAVAQLTDLCTKVQKIYNDQSTYVYKTDSYDDVKRTYIINMFNEEKAMMATTLFLQMELNFEALSELAYGIAPIPKLNKEQENYQSYVQDQVSTFGISAVVGDKDEQEKMAAVLEALAYHSYNIVRPAYYETTLSQRYMQDPQSSEVLDMIYNSMYFDFSSSCSNIFTDCVVRDRLRPILSGSSNTVASSARTWQSAVSKGLANKVNKSLNKLRPSVLEGN